jgi:hypothetical protein
MVQVFGTDTGFARWHFDHHHNASDNCCQVSWRFLLEGCCIPEDLHIVDIGVRLWALLVLALLLLVWLLSALLLLALLFVLLLLAALDVDAPA